jgi:hypothetical protein
MRNNSNCFHVAIDAGHGLVGYVPLRRLSSFPSSGEECEGGAA